VNLGVVSLAKPHPAKKKNNNQNMITRRQAIKMAALAAAAGAAANAAERITIKPSAVAAGTPEPPAGPFVLPPLPYSTDALEPYIDTPTMRLHHDRHHAAYVANLNKAVAGHPALEKKTVEDILSDLSKVPPTIRAAVRNSAGGHANHSLFWLVLSKSGGLQPKGEFHKALEKKFVGFAGFKEEFTKAAIGVFGSGWAWLTLDSNKELRIETTANQDSPLSEDRTPLLTLDVWEHAYYLKYQSRRPEYVAAFFNIINWPFVTERYLKLVG
jgi:Fe-Mn family superoxide dismutase